MNSTRKSNRLNNETSPYLLQHAHNPVNWYPWGDAAFEKAREESKPVFLSIGYSTCHWCHVMAHESFEDEGVAALLNAGFVSVKVDREERPDIDEVYMSVCQAMTGGGGWPLTVLMTPEKKPFFAGTYFPKETVYGRIGMKELLTRVMTLWQTGRDDLIRQSEDISRIFTGEQGRPADGGADVSAIIRQAYGQMESVFDDTYGGFSASPKFPMPHQLLFLLRYAAAYHEQRATDMTRKTLESMYRGGIFDHVGYGFSRYATDEKWLVPHFEKMLYDNALLLRAYTECFAATGQKFFRDVARKIAAYVLRDMRAPEGGFYSAEDADSEGVEGKYYVWAYDELKNRLTEKELRLLETVYGVTEAGNFEGHNILNRLSVREGEDAEQAAVMEKLYAARQKRVPPFKDTKISASWNGMMIEALTRAGVVLDDPDDIDAAKTAADFVLSEMVGDKGELSGTYKDGARSPKGFLADYANIAGALIAVFEATRDLSYLNRAVSLTDRMIRLFWDDETRRFYMAKQGPDELFFRPRDDYDGAVPSGNATAADLLLRLFDLTGSRRYKQIRDAAVSGLAASAAANPGAHIHLIASLIVESVPHRQIVIAANREDPEAADVYRTLIKRFAPFTTVIYYDKTPEMDAVFPELAPYKNGPPFAGYICENFACRQPVYSAAELLSQLKIG